LGPGVGGSPEEGSFVKSEDEASSFNFPMPAPFEAHSGSKNISHMKMSRPSKGKPPLGVAPAFVSSGRGRKKGSLGSKNIGGKTNIKKAINNIDPLTGKRRYTRKKRFTMDNKKLVYRRYSSPERKKTPRLSDKGIWKPTDDLRLIANVLMVLLVNINS